jgi:gluconate 2-dehydrogenase gamma chain
MSKLLQHWDASLPESLRHKHATLVERRAFLGGVVRAAMAASLWPGVAALSGCQPQDQTTAPLLEEHPWKTFAVVQEHLFPRDDGGPGAADINAARYLKFVLEADDTDAQEREFIFNGIGWLDDISRDTHGQAFVMLPADKREAVLQLIARSRAGENWLSYLLLYIFEALLTDPVYGGNPDGIGWRWLEHRPGFPRPPANKRYMNLR